MDYRDQCERCHAHLDLLAEAYLCSYECTFCPRCAGSFRHACPNCSGELVRRPRRSALGGPAIGRRASSDKREGATPPQLGPVERIGPEDVDEVAPLFDAYRQFYRQPSDPALARQFLSDRLQREESTIYVVRSEGRAIGFTQLYPMFSSTACTPLWVLNDLYVVPEERGRGVASLLLERAKSLARETGASGVLLDTALDNPAQHLYEAHGWQQDRAFLHYEWLRDAGDRNPPTRA